MKIQGDWLGHSGTQALCLAMEQAGKRALFVGGCVRNALLGVPVSDIDIATDAEPQTVSDIAQNAGFRVIPTGIDHGTVTVVVQGLAHEVTTFRRDVSTDGRRAVVAFSHDIIADASRRDFTMNALYADRHGEVVDPLDGLPDLMARIVRFVGDADARIQEDYLRILRFFRFHAHYGDPLMGLDAEGLAACAAHVEGLDGLSRERVGAEMRKLLSARDPAPAVCSMATAGVLGRILPGSDPQSLAPLVHLEGDRNPRWLRRLAILGGEDAAPGLRLSRNETADLGRIRDEMGSQSTAAVLAWRFGRDIAADVILCRAALFGTQPPQDWQGDIDRGLAAVFPVSSQDLMPQFSGPALGERLRQLQERWFMSDLRLTKDQLLG
ncbi:MAG: CCA tRNA nucleotidyltransferase [Rhodobacteraceae bacterium]|nr:CCA tRNA nucleotidyltransferase [Paracoccaceae bacterium]MCF8513229.1 CCA tRNA nucleotidyltransferase [Paracoccaceae bacterium]MCF8517872.1 CCA tRNA nucleotidyltransferase [Paracoccaceae bacterium]